MQGAFRFAFFISIVVLVAVGFYANGLRQTIAGQQAAIATLTTDRDAAKAQVQTANKQVADNAAALKDAQAKVTDLQTQLEAAKAPPARRKR